MNVNCFWIFLLAMDLAVVVVMLVVYEVDSLSPDVGCCWSFNGWFARRYHAVSGGRWRIGERPSRWLSLIGIVHTLSG